MRLLLGDCVERMRDLGAASVDAVVTDPPYGLEFMGKDWDRLGQTWHEAWAREALRVLKPGGHLASFGGTRTYHRLASGIEDAGFEIRDTIAWLYGSGFPKSLNVGEGRGTALKPAFEPIVLARKPLAGTVAGNVLEHGTGALNIDASRIEGQERPVMVRTDTVVTATSMSGESTGATASGELTSQGRWPANVVLDEEAAAMLDAQAPNTGGGGFCGGRAFSGELYGAAAKEAPTRQTGRIDANGGASRFFYCAKTSRAERNAGLEPSLFSQATFEERGRTFGHKRCAKCGRQKVNVPGAECVCAEPEWVTVEEHAPRRNHHPTVKPLALMRWLARLVTPPGGLILDPFLGSGSTGCAATLEGFRFVGIEREPEYMRIAEARIAYWAAAQIEGAA